MQRIVGGIFRHRYLKMINKSFKLRPTSDKVRQALFNILNPKIIDAKVLDLFAGTGAVGIEALSRGAESCVFIESNPGHFQLIKDNLATFNLTAEVYMKEVSLAIKILYTKQIKFDIIFLDPPYFLDYGVKTIMNISEHKILNDDGILIWEHEKKEN